MLWVKNAFMMTLNVMDIESTLTLPHAQKYSKTYLNKGTEELSNGLVAMLDSLRVRHGLLKCECKTKRNAEGTRRNAREASKSPFKGQFVQLSLKNVHENTMTINECYANNSQIWLSFRTVFKNIETLKIIC